MSNLVNVFTLKALNILQKYYWKKSFISSFFVDPTLKYPVLGYMCQDFYEAL